MYDTIIIGSGPAGFTAAIYANRRALKTLMIGKDIGGQMTWASEIENYPGFKSISAYDLIAKFYDQVTSLGVEIKNEMVESIEKRQDFFVVNTKNEQISTKTIILSLGLSPRKLNVPGEAEFLGKGICYCANCDGPLYKNKTVVVVGGGNSGLDAAEVLSKIVKQVYLITNEDKLRGFENLVSQVKDRSNIEIFLNSSITSINGSNKVESIKLLNVKNKEKKELKVDGIFIEIGREPKVDLVKDMVRLDNKNQIVVGEECETNVPGMFAAGDVTNVIYKQITIACGQGTIAALAAYKFIQQK